MIETLISPVVGFLLNKTSTFVEQKYQKGYVDVDLELCKRLIKRLPTDMVVSNCEKLRSLSTREVGEIGKQLFLFCLDELERREQPSLHLLSPELSDILKEKGHIS